MKEHIKNHLIAHNQKHGYPVTDEALIETLRDPKAVWKGGEEQHRWWACYTKVVEIDGMLIGFQDARSSGDMSAQERGWEFDPKSVFEAEAKEVTTTVYVEKK